MTTASSTLLPSLHPNLLISSVSASANLDTSEISSSAVQGHSSNMANSTLSLLLANGSTPTASTVDDFLSSYNSSIDYACFHYFHTPAIEIAANVVLFGTLLCVIVGLVGNTLSFLVFSSREMKTVSSNFYLLMLAVSDTAYLITVFLSKTLTLFRCIFATKTNIDIYNKSDCMCKILQYCMDLFSDYSTCLIMAFTVERFIAVYFPLKYKDICTVFRARLCCVLMFVFTAAVIAPYHFMYMVKVPLFEVCTIDPSDEGTFSLVYIVEFIMFRMIPVLIIAILNKQIIIRVTMVTMMKRKQKLGQINKNKRKDDKSMQLTIMLILVSTSYIMLYIPVLVHFILSKLQRNSKVDISNETLTLMQMYTQLLYVSGFAINFFLYTLSGKIFRDQLYNLCRKCGLCPKSAKPKVDATEMTSLM